MESRIYEGSLRHRRFLPRQHHFEYPLFLMYLDLDEVEQVFSLSPLWSAGRANIASFSPRDYMNKNGSIRLAIADYIYTHTGVKFDGAIRMLTNLKYYGYCFNPVTFYFCFYKGASKPNYVIADINNTPWGERYAYLFTTDSKMPAEAKTNAKDKIIRPSSVSSKGYRYQFNKHFHVSPFNPMDMEYTWSLQVPSEKFHIYMRNDQSGEKHFDSTLSLASHSVTPHNLNKILLKYPFMTAKVMLGIYGQALRLWLKRVPFYDHPATN